MTILRAICFGNPNKDTQIYNFHNFFQALALGVEEPPLLDYGTVSSGDRMVFNF